jgi:hypothetical protein
MGECSKESLSGERKCITPDKGDFPAAGDEGINTGFASGEWN